MRLARLDDLDAIGEIYDHYVLHSTATMDTVPRTPQQRREWFDAHPANLHPLLVAVAGELPTGAGGPAGGPPQVVGWSGLWPWSPRAAYLRTAEGSVYVRTGHQGQGVGKRLLSALISHVREQTPVRVIAARISQPNPASNRLHESVGFRFVACLREYGHKFGRLVDISLYDLHLDDTPDRPGAGPGAS